MLLLPVERVKRRRLNHNRHVWWLCLALSVIACSLVGLLYWRLSPVPTAANSVLDASSNSSNHQSVTGNASSRAMVPPNAPAPPNETADGVNVDAFDERLLRVYDATEQRQLASRYLFVRGFAKSGTSWTKMLVDLHRDVYLFPYELQLGLVDEGVARATAAPWQASNEPYKSVVEHWARQLIFQVMEVARLVEPDARYVGEKSPKSVTPIVAGAHYVYVLRDGRDVLVSLFAHRVRIGGFDNWCPDDRMFASSEAQAAASLQDWSFFEQNSAELLAHEPCVRRIVQRWTERVSADLMALKAYDSKLYRVLSYERLTRDPDGERRRVYEWLGLDAQRSESLGLYTMPLAGLSPDSEFRPQNPFFRKGEPGDWRNFFTDDVKRWFKSVPGAQELLQALHYESNEQW
jgi:hypothetical protein